MHGTNPCCTDCRVAEKLATLLGTSPALPSRAGSAMHQALAQAASSNGHTFLSWDQLQPDALRLMSASGQSLHCYLPHGSATSQLGYTQQLPHKRVTPSMCALSCSDVDGQHHTHVLLIEVVLRAHSAHCPLLSLPLSLTRYMDWLNHELARSEAWKIVLYMGSLMIVL